MTDQFEFLLKFKQSGLGAVTSGLSKAQNKMEKLQHDMISFDSLTRRFEPLGAMLGTFFNPMAAGISLATKGINLLVDGMKNFTELAIDGISKKTTIMRNWTMVLGDSAEAQERYFKVARLSQKTEFTKEQLMGTADILTKIPQIKENKDFDKWMGTIADVAASVPEEQRQGAMNRLGLGVKKLYSKQYLQEGTLKQFSEAGGADIKENIAKIMGVKFGDIDTLMRQKKIGADVAAQAIQQTASERLGVKKPGDFATNSAGSIGAMIANLKEAPANFVDAFSTDNMPGYQKLLQTFKMLSDEADVFGGHALKIREFLQGVADVGMGIFAAFLEMANRIGMGVVNAWNMITMATGTFSGTIGEMFDDVFAIIGDILTPIFEVLAIVFNVLLTILRPIIAVVRKVLDVLSAWWEVLVEIFQGLLGIIGAVLEPFIDTLSWIWSGATKIFDGLKGVFTSMKKYVIDAFDFMIAVVSTWFGRISEIMQAFGAILAGVFTFDFDQLSEGVENLKNAVTDSFSDEVVNKVKERQKKRDQEDEDEANKAAAKKKLENKKLHSVDEFSGGGGGRGGSGGGKMGFVYTFSPGAGVGAMDMSKYLAPITTAPSITPNGPVASSANGAATAMQTTTNAPLTINIYEANDAKSTAQEIKVIMADFFKGFGRLTENPSPGVL